MSDEERAVVRISDMGSTVTAVAVARTRSETTTLVFAVTVAVALGIACGIWINSRMAASADAARPAAHARVPSDARAETPTPSAVEPGTLQATAEVAEASPLRAEPSAAIVEARTLKEAAPTPTLAAEATPAAEAPVAAEATPEQKPKARLVASFVSRERSGSEKEGKEEEARPSAPCALYASAASLAVNRGGTALLVVGGPGEPGPVTVSTRSWNDIAVVREGRDANGWVRYAIKSVGESPGTYNVTFSTPCGSQTIPVTVK